MLVVIGFIFVTWKTIMGPGGLSDYFFVTCLALSSQPQLVWTFPNTQQMKTCRWLACGNIKTMPNGFLSPTKDFSTGLVLLIPTLVEQGTLIPVSEFNPISLSLQGQSSKERVLIDINCNTLFSWGKFNHFTLEKWSVVSQKMYSPLVLYIVELVSTNILTTCYAGTVCHLDNCNFVPLNSEMA